MSAQGVHREEARRFEELLAAAKSGSVSVAQVFEDIRKQRISEAEGREVLQAFEQSRALWRRAVANL